MFGPATIPFFILFLALTNLYLGYATAVFLGWGPPARQLVKAAVVVPPPLAASTPTAPIPVDIPTTAAAPSQTEATSTTAPPANAGDSSGPDDLAPELLAAIQSAIDQETRPVEKLAAAQE